MDFTTKIILLSCILGIVQLCLYLSFPTVKKIKRQNELVLEYYPFLKLSGRIALPFFIYLIGDCFKVGSFTGTVSYILILLNLFALFYFNRKITIISGEDYFIYRNLFFLKEKVYYRDVQSFQLYKKMLFINLKKRRIFWDYYYIFNENVLLTEFNNHRVKQLKKVNDRF